MLKVRIPATSGNLGPGFDTIGMAFRLYNYITFEVLAEGLEIEFPRRSGGNIPGEDNIVYQAAKKVFDKVNYHPSGLKLS